VVPVVVVGGGGAGLKVKLQAHAEGLKFSPQAQA
jgi:succinate dehydrogenase/fumarate reductase flavoprotein subunit